MVERNTQDKMNNIDSQLVFVFTRFVLDERNFCTDTFEIRCKYFLERWKGPFLDLSDLTYSRIRLKA